MDFGIILGALLASGLAGKFKPGWRLPFRSLVAAVIGGLLLGYGARLAYGCNIGAYFSGIASSSVHGWLWLVAAFVGSAFGTYMRPWFGSERRAQSRPPRKKVQSRTPRTRAIRKSRAPANAAGALFMSLQLRFDCFNFGFRIADLR